MEYRFSAELKAGYLHVKVRGDNTVSTVRRWVSEGLEACKRHRCGKVLVEEYLQGESLNDRETFMVVVEGARAALTVVTHMAYVDANPAHKRDMSAFAEYVATLRGVNMRVFDDVGKAAQWLVCAGLCAVAGCSQADQIAAEGKMDLQAMRALGKAGIVEKAVEQVRRRKPDYALESGRRDYCRVYAGKRTIKVVLQPVFLASPYGRGEVGKEDLEVQFTEGSVSIQPDDFVKGARDLDEEARRMLGEVLKSKVPQAGERLTIGMKEGAIVVRVSRGYSGGTEEYRIDPQTGKWDMLWHEHPMPPMKMGPVVELRKDGSAVEIEEEVFQEIR